MSILRINNHKLSGKQVNPHTRDVTIQRTISLRSIGLHFLSQIFCSLPAYPLTAFQQNMNIYILMMELEKLLPFEEDASFLDGMELAKKADINSRVLQTYEQDDRDIAGAKLKTLLKVCVALECRLEDIVTDDETLALIAAYNRR